MSQYYLQLNDSKTQLIVFGPSKVLNEIELHGVEIAPNTLVMFVPTVKNLGLVMDNQLVFDKQIVNLKKKFMLSYLMLSYLAQYQENPLPFESQTG